MIIVYEGNGETIICSKEDQERIIEEYFGDLGDRNIEDYDVIECNDVRINASLHVRTY